MNRDIKVCNCKKSNCLKLYCDCFANGSYCNPGKCNCVTCMNNVENESKRNRAIFSTIERDSSAFRPKVISKELEKSHKKGCNCKRSNCLKKYCECYQGSIMCSDKCKCVECLNVVGMSSHGQSSLFSLATAGQMIAANDYYRAERSSSVGSTQSHLEGSEQSEGFGIRSKLTLAAQQTAGSSSSVASSSSSCPQKNYPGFSYLAQQVTSRASTTDTGDFPQLPKSMLKRVCESLLEDLTKKIRSTGNDRGTDDHPESYVFVDSDGGREVSMTQAVISSFCATLKRELSDPSVVASCMAASESSESKPPLAGTGVCGTGSGNSNGNGNEYPAQMSSSFGGFYSGFGSQQDSREPFFTGLSPQPLSAQQDSLLFAQSLPEYSQPLSQTSHDERTMGGSVTPDDFFQAGLTQSQSNLPPQSYARNMNGAGSQDIELRPSAPSAPSSSSRLKNAAESEELSSVAKDSVRDSIEGSIEGSVRDSARSTYAPSPTTFATDSADETAVTSKESIKVSKFQATSGIQLGETHVVPI